jgi:hypothetical protein
MTEEGSGPKGRTIAGEVSEARWGTLAGDFSENAGFLDTVRLVSFAEVANTDLREQGLTVGVTWPTFATALGPPTVPVSERPSMVPVTSVA